MPSDETPFSWEVVERDWLWRQPDGGLNLASQCLDRHLAEGRGDQEALVVRRRDGARRCWSYAQLTEAAARFAEALARSRVHLAERVCTLLPRREELYITALGTLRAGALYAPLTTVLGPEPIRQRLTVGEAKVLVTTRELYRERIQPIRGSLQTLQHVVLVDGQEPEAEHWDRFCARAVELGEPALTGSEFPALLHFTSGTTGTPKGVLHVHRAAAAHLATSRIVLGLEPGTRYWCTADPGWVTGVTYGLLGPLLSGATLIADENDFSTALCRRVISEEDVGCWLTVPTELRMLQGTDDHDLDQGSFPTLHTLFTTGEPLDAHLSEWARMTLGAPARDAWWQSETGAIMTAQYGERPVVPGRMGDPIPGIELCLMQRDDQGNLSVVEEAGERGEIAIRRGWPSMFRAYLGDSERYRQAFVGDWYLSGDWAEYDEQGELRFIGRADDIIKTAGHMIGPAEIEAVLNHHPEVAESAVAGVPDPVAGMRVAAWVVPRHPLEDKEVLAGRLIEHTRRRLGTPVAPSQIEFVDQLPKTPTGKIRRADLG